MKSVISSNTCSKIGFPKLMQYPFSGNIVLWRNKEEGTYVHIPVGNNTKIGDRATYNTGWKDYSGSICLENT